MPPRIFTQPVPLMIGSHEADGQTVYADGMLTAVLVRLEGEHYGECEHCWYLEAGFGPCAEKRPDPFPALDDATEWIREQVCRG